MFSAAFPPPWHWWRKRQLPSGRKSLGGREPNEQRAHQPGPLCGGHEIDVLERDGCLLQRVLDEHVDELEVVAGRDLRHDAAEAAVHGLRGDDVGKRRAAGAHNRRAGVVAARLERKYVHTTPGFGTSSSLPARVAGVRHITSASSPLSW